MKKQTRRLSISPGYFTEFIELDVVLNFAVSGLQHIHQGIDGSKQFKTAVGYLIRDHGIIHVYLIDKSLVDKVIEVFLYLAVAHVGGIHYFRLAGAVLADSQHIGDYLNIGTALAHARPLGGIAVRSLFAI